MLSLWYKFITCWKSNAQLLLVSIIVGTLINNLKNKLVDKIKNTIGLTMRVDVMDYNRIPRSTGGKLQRVIDKRDSKNQRR